MFYDVKYGLLESILCLTYGNLVLYTDLIGHKINDFIYLLCSDSIVTIIGLEIKR